MDRPRFQRSSRILIGIGLVLVGLLAGILAMLFVVDWRPGEPVATRVVERVELGRAEPLRPISTPSNDAPVALPDLNTLNGLFKDVARHVTPAVVYIQVQGAPPSREWFRKFENDDGLHDRLFRDMPRQSVGSGVIVSGDGYVVTNYHVVSGANRIDVTLDDKRQFEAEIVGVDPSTDLAVIKVKGRGLPVVALGDSDEIEVGEWVLAVGNPFRLTSTVTAGIVSALGRQVNIIDDRFRIEDFIQTDAAINPGNSGGALVNLDGELVGISTAIATESGSYEGYGFAVPVNLMERVVHDLIAYGEVQRGFLGVTILEIDAAAARELGLDRVGGVYVRETHRGGAAHRAGVRDGDVVLSVGGRSVNAPNELQSAVARHRPGEEVALEVWRRGKVRTVWIELLGRDAPAYQEWFAEAEPEPERAPAPNPHRPSDVFELEEWGLGLRELSRRDRASFGVEAGVYLAYVEHGSLADQAGLPRDVIVTGIGEVEIDSIEEIVTVLGLSKNDDAVLVRVLARDGLTAFYELDAPRD